VTVPTSRNDDDDDVPVARLNRDIGLMLPVVVVVILGHSPGGMDPVLASMIAVVVAVVRSRHGSRLGSRLGHRRALAVVAASCNNDDDDIPVLRENSDVGLMLPVVIVVGPGHSLPSADKMLASVVAVVVVVVGSGLGSGLGSSLGLRRALVAVVVANLNYDDDSVPMVRHNSDIGLILPMAIVVTLGHGLLVVVPMTASMAAAVVVRRRAGGGEGTEGQQAGNESGKEAHCGSK